MAKKKKILDRITIISMAAEKEGLSYGKYMAKHNYAPPCLENVPEEGITVEEKPDVAGNLNGEVEKPIRWEKSCVVCGEWFTPNRRDQVCCSRECMRERGRERERLKYLEGKVQRYCEICGEPLPLSVSPRIFTCSKACSAERAGIKSKERNRKYREDKLREKGE